MNESTAATTRTYNDAVDQLTTWAKSKAKQHPVRAIIKPTEQGARCEATEMSGERSTYAMELDCEPPTNDLSQWACWLTPDDVAEPESRVEEEALPLLNAMSNPNRTPPQKPIARSYSDAIEQLTQWAQSKATKGNRVTFCMRRVGMSEGLIRCWCHMEGGDRSQTWAHELEYEPDMIDDVIHAEEGLQHYPPLGATTRKTIWQRLRMWFSR